MRRGHMTPNHVIPGHMTQRYMTNDVTITSVVPADENKRIFNLRQEEADGVLL